MFPRYISGLQRLKLLKNLSSLSFSLLFLPRLSFSNFLNPSPCCLSPPFITIFPPLPLSLDGLSPTGFGRYLSHQPSILPSFNHEGGLLGVLPLFRPVTQYLMWLTLDEEPH